MVYKEFTADQVLALAFIAYGKDSLVGYQEFDNVFDALRSELHKNNFLYYFGINMPMHNNFDISLFRELKSGEFKGKYKLVNAFTEELREKQFDKLTNHLYEITGRNMEELEIYRKVLKEIRKKEERKKEYEVLKEKLDMKKTEEKRSLKTKIKRFVWSKR